MRGDERISPPATGARRASSPATGSTRGALPASTSCLSRCSSCCSTGSRSRWKSGRWCCARHHDRLADHDGRRAVHLDLRGLAGQETGGGEVPRREPQGRRLLRGDAGLQIRKLRFPPTASCRAASPCRRRSNRCAIRSFPSAVSPPERRGFRCAGAVRARFPMFFLAVCCEFSANWLMQNLSIRDIYVSFRCLVQVVRMPDVPSIMAGRGCSTPARRRPPRAASSRRTPPFSRLSPTSASARSTTAARISPGVKIMCVPADRAADVVDHRFESPPRAVPSSAERDHPPVPPLRPMVGNVTLGLPI